MSIRLENISFSYEKGKKKNIILHKINAEIKNGEFIGIMGHAGSGKSTLIQLLNGILKPIEGSIYLNENKITKKDYKKYVLRDKVGMVFQYPEQQLFEKTVIKDVCFGPLKQGFSEKESLEKAKKALELVKIDNSYFEQSPLELSGGQKRRVAIAGVLAMEPEYLILDEPTAGLDPVGRKEILKPIKQLNESKTTIIFISHNMEDMAEYTDRLIVLDKGKIVFDDITKEVFKHKTELEKIGLKVPEGNLLLRNLKQKGFNLDTDKIKIDEVIEEIVEKIKKRGINNE